MSVIGLLVLNFFVLFVENVRVPLYNWVGIMAVAYAVMPSRINDWIEKFSNTHLIHYRREK
tara:strand:- start:395 stop:577 length:183 start_codon:yes stop_codon:yes gene_type:complete